MTTRPGPWPSLTLPANHEAEMFLLGAILTNNAAYDHVAGLVAPEDFADDRHGRIFAACAELIERSQRADPFIFKARFESDGSLDGFGGTQYLAQFTAVVISPMLAPPNAGSPIGRASARCKRPA
jgi:replicative DNA helicase